MSVHLIGEGTDTFACMLVREFLKKKKLGRSLAVFDAEIRNKKNMFKEMLDDKVSTNIWLTMLQRVGLAVHADVNDAHNSTSSIERVIARAAENVALSSSTAVVVPPSQRSKKSEYGNKSKGHKRYERGIHDIGEIEESSSRSSDRGSFNDHTADVGRSFPARAGGKKRDNSRSPRSKFSRQKAHGKVSFIPEIAKRGAGTSKKSIARPRRALEDHRGDAKLSKESWIPMPLRMRMLRRDMSVMKVNRESMKQLDEVYFEKSRKNCDTHSVNKSLERSKRNDELTRRGRKKHACALCDMNYTPANLPFRVSYKAIIDLRLSWGVEIPPDSRYSRFPHWYKSVKVCQFCSQFFQLEGGLFDSPDRGLLKKETLSDNDQHTLEKMGLRTSKRSTKRSTIFHSLVSSPSMSSSMK